MDRQFALSILSSAAVGMHLVLPNCELAEVLRVLAETFVGFAQVVSSFALLVKGVASAFWIDIKACFR